MSIPFPQLTSEQRETLMDVGQLTLDVAGIFDPTPISDVSSAVISIARGAWMPAAISALAVVPYLGDLAKLAGLPRYVATVERAILLARMDARFASVLSPALTSLDGALARVPVAHVPRAVGDALTRMRRQIAEFLPAGVRAGQEIAKLTDAMLVKVFGSATNIGRLPRENMETIVGFLRESNFAGGDLDKWATVAKAMDLHAAEKIVVVDLPAGTLVRQYVAKTKDATYVGQWLVVNEKGFHQSALALGGSDREVRLFTLMRSERLLKSRTSRIIDTWSDGLAGNATAFARENGKTVARTGEFTLGGGVQYFLPEAWNKLRPLK